MGAIVQSYTVEATPEQVFRALTEADELERWWVTRAESEPETGGRFRYIWEFEDPEKNGRQEARYEEVTPPTRLRYPWEVGPAETEVTFELERANGGTKLTLRHEGYPEEMADAREVHADAWSAFLGNLQSYLAEGVDRRPELMGQKVG